MPSPPRASADLTPQELQDVVDGVNTKCDEIHVPRGAVEDRPDADLPRGFVLVRFGSTVRIEIGHVDDTTGLERTGAEVRALARATIHGQFRPGDVVTPLVPGRGRPR